jgi:hypothetical protein
MLILLLVLVVLLLAAAPSWPYRRGWGYYPVEPWEQFWSSLLFCCCWVTFTSDQARDGGI